MDHEQIKNEIASKLLAYGKKWYGESTGDYEDLLKLISRIEKNGISNGLEDILYFIRYVEDFYDYKPNNDFYIIYVTASDLYWLLTHKGGDVQRTKGYKYMYEEKTYARDVYSM